MRIPEISVRNPVAVVMLFAGFCLLGYLSLDRLGIDLLPDITTPKIVVTLRAGDLSPQELEEKYGRNMEAMLSTVSRVKRVSTMARVGKLVCTVEFQWDTDMDFAQLDVQKSIGYLQADRDVKELNITRFDPNADPAMIVGIADPGGSRSLQSLRTLAEKSLKPALEGLDGVALVRVAGGRQAEVDVEVDPYRLESLGIDMQQLSAKIRGANLDSSGGTIEDSQKVYIVKGMGAFRSVDDIKEVVVAFKETGDRTDLQPGQKEKVPVRLDEIARVALSHKEVRNIVHLGGIEGVGVAIYKEPQKNTVLVARRIERSLDQWRQTVPGVVITTVRDQARFIRDSIRELEQAAGIGVLLAFLVLFGFLRSFRTTIIVGLAIPLSVVITFVLMYFGHLTLNIMTLGGLALGAGMLVDNAIVVVENIFRLLEEGRSPREAAIEGTAQVSGAIIASTLTTCVVFLPIVFVKGIAAELFKEKAFTVGFSLLSSLLVAFLLIPMLGSRWLKARPVSAHNKVRHKTYWKLLSLCLDHKLLVVLAAAGAVTGAAYIFMGLKTEFMPKADQGEFAVRLRLPEGTRVEVTEATVTRIEQECLDSFPQAIKTIYSDIGERTFEDTMSAEEAFDENTADVHVALAPLKERSVSSFQIVERLAETLKTIPDLDFRFLLEGAGLKQSIGSSAQPVTIEILGNDVDQLASLTRTIASMLPEINEDKPSIFNIRTSFEGGRSEARLHVDRLVAGMFDLTLEKISQAVSTELSGEVVTEYFTGEDLLEIRLNTPERNIEELMEIQVEAPDGVKVKLKDLGRVEMTQGPKKILRRDQSRVGLVTADLQRGASFKETVSRIEQGISSLRVPAGIKIIVGGEERERRESFDSLRFALLLSMALIYMVMASQFESFLHPFTIILTLPLAGVGAALAFHLTGTSLNIMGIIGIIMLAGIAVNDSIILVDYTNRLRAQGMELSEAVLMAGQARLRPIMMTSLTTILALLPLAFGFGEGASLRAPMAIAVIGGLTTSTLLTLLVIPVFYSLIERLRPGRSHSAGGAGRRTP